MRSIGKQISDFYRSETEQHALSVAQTTQLTIIISIASIVLVCILISPIICRIEQRKYMGLKFFLNVEPNHLILLETQIREFLNLAFSDASVHTGTTHQEDNVNQKGFKRMENFKNQYMDNEQYNKDMKNGLASSSSSEDEDNRRDDNGDKIDNNEDSESRTYDSSVREEQLSAWNPSSDRFEINQKAGMKGIKISHQTLTVNKEQVGPPVQVPEDSLISDHNDSFASLS